MCVENGKNVGDMTLVIVLEHEVFDNSTKNVLMITNIATLWYPLRGGQGYPTTRLGDQNP